MTSTYEYEDYAYGEKYDSDIVVKFIAEMIKYRVSNDPLVELEWVINGITWDKKLYDDKVNESIQEFIYNHKEREDLESRIYDSIDRLKEDSWDIII